MAEKTKRQQLGALIAQEREDLNITRHTLGDKTRTPVANIERWERGDLVPTTQEIQRARAVLHKLDTAPARELFRLAALEQVAELSGHSPTTAVNAAPDLNAAVTLILDAMPALRSMAIEVDDDGEVRVSYKTREVRIVEDSGTLQLPRRRP